jgi:hypothetical protein
MIWRKSTYSASNGGCVEVGWRRSSFSAGNGNCVEVGWQKSSFSVGNGDCVEVAVGVTAVAVRDSKNTDGPVLDFPPTHWHTFLDCVS